MTAISRPPALSRKTGFTLLLTGLSGAGKSSIATHLIEYLETQAGRTATLLDGDEVRKNLGADLGFSPADRHANLMRVAYVAAEVTRHGGIAICAMIAPYAADRSAMRERIEHHGRFLEVHISTPLQVCESRDSKGLYAKARAGEIEQFTGVSSPYEVPQRPDFELDSSAGSTLAATQKLIAYLQATQALQA